MRLRSIFGLVILSKIVASSVFRTQNSTKEEPMVSKKNFWYLFQNNDVESQIQRDLRYCKLVMSSSSHGDALKTCQTWLKRYLKHLQEKLDRRIEQEIKRYKEQVKNSSQVMNKTASDHVLRISRSN